MKKLLVSLLVFLLVVFTLTGCEGFIPGSSPLAGSQWKLVSWSEGLLDPSQFTITAHFDESNIFGTSAINSYSGSYIATANHLFSVGELQMTLIGGSDEAMQAESTYFQLLQEAQRYTLNQNKLILFDVFGNDLLIFSMMEPIVGLAIDYFCPSASC